MSAGDKQGPLWSITIHLYDGALANLAPALFVICCVLHPVLWELGVKVVTRKTHIIGWTPWARSGFTWAGSVGQSLGWSPGCVRRRSRAASWPTVLPETLERLSVSLALCLAFLSTLLHPRKFPLASSCGPPYTSPVRDNCTRASITR